MIPHVRDHFTNIEANEKENFLVFANMAPTDKRKRTPNSFPRQLQKYSFATSNQYSSLSLYGDNKNMKGQQDSILFSKVSLPVKYRICTLNLSIILAFKKKCAS